MSVPIARETLCQATERILIITRARYRPPLRAPTTVFENERPVRRLCVFAQFNEITTREFGTRAVKGTRESSLQPAREFGSRVNPMFYTAMLRHH